MPCTLSRYKCRSIRCTSWIVTRSMPMMWKSRCSWPIRFWRMIRSIVRSIFRIMIWSVMMRFVSCWWYIRWYYVWFLRRRRRRRCTASWRSRSWMMMRIIWILTPQTIWCTCKRNMIFFFCFIFFFSSFGKN